MFSFRNLYGNIGEVTSYEGSIPETSEQASLANENGQPATVKARNLWVSIVGLIVAAYLLSR